MCHTNNDISTFDNHIKLSFPQSPNVTSLSSPLSNSLSVQFKSEAIPNEHFLHSPTSVRLTQKDLVNIDLHSRCQHIRHYNPPFFPNEEFQPFFHCPTKKTTLLTTRLLYPKTKLPSSFLSPNFPIMPVFKNRLHRTNALRKLFEDVKIDDLTYANAQILHQRVSSMALKPTLSGYHLDDAYSLDDMKEVLMVIHSHLEDKIKLDKTITPKDKTKKDKNYVAIVEIARSLLPDQMILDINFPVTILLGLSHEEAISLLRNYFNTQGITKTPQFFEKRC